MEEAPLDRQLIDQVLDQVTQLRDVDDSARAEAWASGVLGLWREPGADVDAPAADRQLIEALVEAGSDDACALAHTLTEVGSESSRDAARAAVAALEQGGAMPPPWSSSVGTAKPGDGWSIADPGTAHRTVIIEFISDDGSHTMLAELEESRLTDLAFGPPAADLFAALDEPGVDPLEPQETDSADLATELAAAWSVAMGEGVMPTESWVMNRSLALRRLELFAPVGELESMGWNEVPESGETPGSLPEDREADAAARAVLIAALGEFDGSPTGSVGDAAPALRIRIEAGGWPAVAISEGGGLDRDLNDVDFVLAAAAAYASRGDLPMPADEAAAVAALEWADWLGAVIEMVRSGSGSRITAAGLVDNVNRCPEVSTTIPKRDREYFEKAFGLVIEAWRFCGFLDADDRLTVLGMEAIPGGLDRAWSDHQGGD